MLIETKIIIKTVDLEIQFSVCVILIVISLSVPKKQTMELSNEEKKNIIMHCQNFFSLDLRKEMYYKNHKILNITYDHNYQMQNDHQLSISYFDHHASDDFHQQLNQIYKL